MAEPAPRSMTADEFLGWDDGTDTRHELVDGVVVAMAPTTDAHGTILGNVGGEIASWLEERPPCRAVAAAGICLDGRNLFLADVAVTCAKPRGQHCVEAPFLIVEIAAESTESRDFGARIRRYVELPSLDEFWLIDSRERWVQVWRRSGDAWIVSLPMRGDGVGFASEALGGEPVALDRLYRNTGL